MKFATHTPMTSASYNDIQLASLQGSIVGVALQNSGKVFGQGGYQFSTPSSKGNIGLFVSSFVFMVAGFFYKKHVTKQTGMEEPMISNDYVVA